MWKKIEYGLWSLVLKENEDKIGFYNHSHHDFLHLNLNYDQIPILIDTGRGSYSDTRAHSKSYLPEYHNSVRINGLGYKPDNMRLYPPEYINHIHDIKIDELDEKLKITIFTNGFNRIDKEINFKREVSLYKDRVVIKDISEAKKSYLIENFFHFNNNLEIVDKKTNLLTNGKNKFRFISNNSCTEYKNSIYNKDLYYISRQYGELEESFGYYISQNFNLDESITHKIIVS